MRFTRTVTAADTTLAVTMPTNWASSASGATVTGDGVNLGSLVDDTESTNWASLGQPVAGRSVTVHLGGGPRTVEQVRVSAYLRPADANDANDPDGQSRFSALRAFELWTCDASAGADCSEASSFSRAFASAADAFPGTAPRPVAPDLALRTFDVPDVRATDVKLVVVSNQCTGGPAFAGEQDDDPSNDTDCATASAEAQNVRVAELEVLGA